MTDEERMALMKLRTYLMRVDLEDPVIESDFARDIVEKARLLTGSSALSDEEKAKYARVVEIFSKFC